MKEVNSAMESKETVNIGFVYSGISYQSGLLDKEKYQKQLSIIPVCLLADVDLLSYDALVFPRGTDQEMVFAVRQKIKGFLDAGKILISFGEVTKPWLPACEWDGVIPEDDGPLVITKTHPILQGLSADDLHWHKGVTGWCCHGHFKNSPTSEVLVTNEIGNPIVYVDSESTKGLILALSQLDADCHLYHGIPAAELLFDNILDWIRTEGKRTRGVA
ncbi:MAG: hypothetical protein ABFD18_04225 [Syntrophomonas sp.]